MSKHKKQNVKEDKGFTLIEMIVTVAIIAIFSGVVLILLQVVQVHTEIHPATQKFRWKHRRLLIK